MLDFHELYARYAPEVYRFAYWLSGDPAEAEDITSEAFVRAWINLARIRTETLKAYLMTIARNIYLEQLRKRRRQSNLEDGHPDSRPGPEQQAENQAELEAVRKVLGTLPEVDRAAFILRVQHDLPYAEIGRVLQCSEIAAKVKVHRTRKRLLRARMSKEVA